MDRASVRTIDADGRMHIAMSHISKANVCAYYGYEIPNSEKLGLKPGKLYKLLRDPEELKKAAPTFNRIPVLEKHIPVDSKEPQKESIVGTTGSNSSFDGEYLNNDLAIWVADAIAGINTGEQKELSAAYHYTADMTPGVFNGEAYDGVMRDIIGNHVALVETGRAGPDVVVGDSQPQMETHYMKIQKGKTAAVKAALCAHVLPKIALDSAAIPRIASLVKHASTVERLAQDAAEEFPEAGLERGDLVKLLRMALAAAEAGEKPQEVAEDEEDGADDPANYPASEDDDMAEDDDEADPKPNSGVPPKPEDEEEKPKPAMDAAAIARRAEANAMARFKAIREAERDVAPLVGEVVAMDSAAAVYRFAMDSVGIEYEGVHPSAYRALVAAHKKSIAPKAAPKTIGMDSSVQTALEALMPNLAKR